MQVIPVGIHGIPALEHATRHQDQRVEDRGREDRGDQDRRRGRAGGVGGQAQCAPGDHGPEEQGAGVSHEGVGYAAGPVGEVVGQESEDRARQEQIDRMSRPGGQKLDDDEAAHHREGDAPGESVHPVRHVHGVDEAHDHQQGEWVGHPAQFDLASAEHRAEGVHADVPPEHQNAGCGELCDEFLAGR